MTKLLGKLLGCQRGATAIEYGLIAAILTVAIIGGLTQVNDSNSGMWAVTEDELGAAMTP